MSELPLPEPTTSTPEENSNQDESNKKYPRQLMRRTYREVLKIRDRLLADKDLYAALKIAHNKGINEKQYAIAMQIFKHISDEKFKNAENQKSNTSEPAAGGSEPTV